MSDQTEVRNAENARKRHFVVNKKNVFCVNRSDHRKSFLDDFIRNRLKIEQNCRLFLEFFFFFFFSAIMNNLFMTFIFRLKVDAKCVYQQ